MKRAARESRLTRFRAFMIAGAVVSSVLLVVGCKAQIRYSLEVDVLSFIPEDEHSRDWAAADDSPDRAIFLPYAEKLFAQDEPVESELRKGVVFDVPVPDDPGIGDITLSFTVDVEISNQSDAGSISDAAFRLLAAPYSVEDVYTDGQVLLTFDIADIPAGESRMLAGTKTLRRGDPGFDVLVSGEILRGVDGFFRSDQGVVIGYDLNIMRVRISIRPSSLLP